MDQVENGNCNTMLPNIASVNYLSIWTSHCNKMPGHSQNFCFIFDSNICKYFSHFMSIFN